MTNNDHKIEIIQSEKEDNYSDDSIYNISSWGADLSFRELIARFDDNELVKPEIQRKYVWDKTEASYFIDSILLGLPLPSIFLARTSDERLLIIDGFQRIMTVYDYVGGVFSKDNKTFKLTKTDKINKKWRGKAFLELSTKEQRKIKNTTIHSIIFEQVLPLNDNTSMFQIFERINTSGRTLTTQEIRNCVYQGLFNTKLIELNKYSKWREVFGLSQPESRMRDIEFILRFLALYHLDFIQITKKSISLKKYLNEFMGSDEALDSDILEEWSDLFIKSIDFAYDLFGKEAFHNISPKYPDKLVKKFHPTIFDSILIACAIALKDGVDVDTRQIKNKRRNLLIDAEYQEATTIRTTNIDAIATRINKALFYLFGITNE